MNTESSNSISRRGLLRGAVGAAVLAPALRSTISGEEAPAPARIRETFDFGWKFFKGDAVGAQLPGFSDSSWTAVDLPHDWSVEGPFGEKEPSGGTGGYLPTGVGWYRKRFSLPDARRDRMVTIEFDGAYMNSEVWINGHYLGKRPYGYIPFAYDLTPHLNPRGDNMLAVKVDNSRQTNCRWYSGSGIFRHTWILETNPLHVAYWGSFVTTPRVSKDAATIQVKTKIRNDGTTAARCTLSTSVLDKDGNVVQSDQAIQEVGAQSDYEFVQQLRLDKPQLWSVETPYLYKVRSTVREQNRVTDVYHTPFGIRDASFDADQGFLLNGERVKLNGVCLHHDAGCVGAAVPERVWARRRRESRW